MLASDFATQNGDEILTRLLSGTVAWPYMPPGPTDPFHAQDPPRQPQLMAGVVRIRLVEVLKD